MADTPLPKIAFVASDHRSAKRALASLQEQYKALHGTVSLSQADVIVALGGDGFMLETLHKTLDLGKPIFGLNRGSVGFLMNDYQSAPPIDVLLNRVASAQAVDLHPLKMHCTSQGGDQQTALAINEVSLLRQTRQAAKLKISVDGIVRLAELVCDGIILTTAAGSTAYNLSAHGPILPLGCGLLALTPLSPFRPRRWRGALLPHTANVRLEILEHRKRPVSAVADYTEVRNVKFVDIVEDRTTIMTILFDPEHHLEERILKEQFLA